MLLIEPWATVEADLRRLGERRPGSAATSFEFLATLGFVEEDRRQLSPTGLQYFRLRFIDENAAAAVEILRNQLLTCCPEAAAICQLLTNRPKAGRMAAETVLRSQGYGEGLTGRRLGSLLALMAQAQLIEYPRGEGAFRVLARPLREHDLLASVFIAPDTPWSNRKWLARLLDDCRGYIYWFDKHFVPEGLDFIGESADGGRISDVRVLSLPIEANQTRRAKRASADLAKELLGRGITFEWRFAQSADLRDTHDRWVITEGRAWNLPNLNAILSGQHSEITASTMPDTLRAMFEKLWLRVSSVPVAPIP